MMRNLLTNLGLMVLLSTVGMGFAKAQTYVSLSVNQPSALVADAGQDILICPGDTAFIGAPTAGGTSPYANSWAPTTGITLPNDNPTGASPTVTTQYTLTVTDANNCTSTASVSVVVDTCVRITDPVAGVSLDVYPNPTRGQVRIEFNASRAIESGMITVANVEGKVVFEQSIEAQQSQGGWNLDLSRYGTGMYLVTLKTGDRTFTRRLLVQ